MYFWGLNLNIDKMKKAIFFALAATLTVTSWAQTKQAVPVKPATAVKKVVTSKTVATKSTAATNIFKNTKDNLANQIKDFK